jgi:26S proteasome regulatory subunit N8
LQSFHQQTFIMAGSEPTADGPGVAAAATSSSSNEVTEVTIHPLVLLSVTDHYHRVARGTRKRVVGVLLGQVHRGVADVANSFAVPFEEDARNPVSVTNYNPSM